MSEDKRLTQHLVDSILWLSIMDDDFLALSRSIVPKEIFGSVVMDRVAAICYAYHDLYSRAPRIHFHDEFMGKLETMPADDRELAVDYINRLQAMQAPDRDYVIRRLNEFIRIREFERTAVEVARCVQNGDTDKAEESMHRALKAGIRKEHIGIDYLNDPAYMARRMDIQDALISTGWDTMDAQLNGGFKRGQFVVVLGKYKGKKSWCLTNIGLRALLRGLVVVHISHENSVLTTEMRYDRMAGALVGKKEAQEIEAKYWRPDVNGFAIEKMVRPSVFDGNAVRIARRAVARFGGKLIIKKFAMGSASMRDVRSYLDYLERYENIVADVVLNDYADIMAPMDPRQDKRHQINETYIWHKRTADERNIVLITASQATRSSLTKRSFSANDFAEDIRKLGNVDVAIGTTQTEEQKKFDMMTAGVIGSREDDDSAGTFRFGTCLDMGQFNMWEATPEELGEYETEEETKPGYGARKKNDEYNSDRDDY